MNQFGKAACAALVSLAALGATPASAVTIANPSNTSDLQFLSGSLTGGNQTQYFGETFTAPITGLLTDFQFTLNSSTLTSLYGVVYAWDGAKPTTELWRSATVPGTAGLLDFQPTGVTLTQGQTYVAFLSTFGLTGNSGLASAGSCLTFVNCNANTIPNLGTVILGNVQGGNVVFSPIVNNSRDMTFSATITAPVPESATWAMLVLGFGLLGFALRRSKQMVRVTYA
jgi:hypothetical protein